MTKNDLIDLCRAARAALPALAEEETKQKILKALADALISEKEAILAANRNDLKAARAAGIGAAMLDRLTLDEGRLCAVAASVRDVAALESPLGLLSENVRPNGLCIRKYRVPLGVIAMIYEARPNVTVDAAALCLRSGNAVVLRGGSEALGTNTALVAAIRRALAPFGAEDAVALVTDTDRALVSDLLTLRGKIDLVIPRGGAGLIRNVVENARVPVIETGAGNCHVYVHESADIPMAVSVIVNAKTQRPSVCNAAENLLCDEAIAARFLPEAAKALVARGVELRAGPRALAYLPDAVAATPEDCDREYNDYILFVEVVDGLSAAVDHINRHGTKHSEAIVAADPCAADYFMTHIDAAAVYHNASTRFTDGGVFGMGAEIGISTQKLHVRGPFALEALTTTQYRVSGNGQVRE